MKDSPPRTAPPSEPDAGVAGAHEDIVQKSTGPDLTGILVVDPKTLTGDLDPIATLTEGMIEMWEDILLYRPEASGPAN